MSPVAISCSPYSSSISVPLADLFPTTLRPHLASSSSINSFGKPVSVKVWKGFCIFSPIISQCPVIVSFPTLVSLRAAKYPNGFSTVFTFLIGCRLANPNFCRFGILREETDLAILPSVSTPISPNFSESFIAPIPNESNTIVKILLYFFILISFLVNKSF